MKKMRGVPSLRPIFRRRTLINGLKVMEFILGLIFTHIGIGGVAATMYGMAVFRSMQLGGPMVEDIVGPIANTGVNGMIVSGGVIALGLLLMRRLWLIPFRYLFRFLGRRGIKAPRGIFGSPVALYRSVVRFRNWFLAKVEYLQSESAKWKTTFNILKSPYSLLRAMGFSPQMAMTLLFAGSTVTTGVVANEVFEGKSFSRGDSGVYSAAAPILDTPVEWSEEYNTLRIDLGSTPVREITIKDVSIGTAFTGSALPSGQQNAVDIGGVGASSGFTATRLEVGHLIFEKSRCKKLELSDIHAHTIIIRGNAADGISIAPSPGTSRMLAISGGHHQAEKLETAGGTYDRIWIQAPSSGVNGKVDKLTLSNLWTKGGPCVLSKMTIGTLEILLNEVGIGDGFSTKEFTVATNVTGANITIEDNVEVSISEPATS
jgi:hypothetical protein